MFETVRGIGTLVLSSTIPYGRTVPIFALVRYVGIKYGDDVASELINRKRVILAIPDSIQRKPRTGMRKTRRY